MGFTLTVTGLSTMQERLAALADELIPTVADVMETNCDDSVEMLATAAPKGESGGGGEPLEGDAPGHLAESFSTVMSVGTSTVVAAVHTDQPHKLLLVRTGTGIYGPLGHKIVPRTKKALAWPGGEHPYRSVRGMRPNEFVTPVARSVPARISAELRAAFTDLMRGL